MVNKRRTDNIMFHRGLRKANKSNDAEDDVLWCFEDKFTVSAIWSFTSKVSDRV